MSKFDSRLDEALYTLTLDGTDETTGSVEAPTGHAVLMHIDKPFSHLQAGFDRPVTVPAGHYIVKEDSQGFVTVETFQTAEDANEEFRAIDAEYAEWLGDDDVPVTPYGWDSTATPGEATPYGVD